MRSENTTPTQPDTVTVTYNHYIAELSRIGTREFKLTPTEARNLAHEVLIASLGAAPRISQLRPWLNAAMRSAAKTRREDVKI